MILPVRARLFGFWRKLYRSTKVQHSHSTSTHSNVQEAVDRQWIYLKSHFSPDLSGKMKLYTDEKNYSLLKVLAAANVAKKKLNVEIITHQSSAFKNAVHLHNSQKWDPPVDNLDPPKRRVYKTHKLPYLELDEGSYLFNANAICCYLLESEKEDLICQASDRPKVDEVLEWDVSSVQPHVLQYLLASTNGTKAHPEILESLHRCLNVLDTLITPQKSIVGGSTTVADIVMWGSLFAVLHKNPEFEDTQKSYPSVYEWFHSISSKSEFKTVINEVLGNGDVTVFKESINSTVLPPSALKLRRGGNHEAEAEKEEVFEKETEGLSPAELTKAKDKWTKGRSYLPAKRERKHPVLPVPNEKNILITSALPYVNNVPHLGNIIGCVLSADVYARYCRLRGYNSLYICGTDEYGTATETKAMEEGVSPQEICNKYNKIHQDVYKWFNIDFDYFGRTTTQEQTKIAQDIFWKLDKNGYLLQDTIDQLHCEGCQRFLADRFVEGTCPHCSFEDARGDQCDACGKLINAVDLKAPRCKVCKTQPVVKSTKHVFLDLPKIEPDLKTWVSKAYTKGQWTNNAIRITEGWIQEGLRPRCITRDLKWGTPVPMEGFTDKVFYVWFDAPIGYLSITANYTDQWEKWWKNPDQVTLVQFMAKDNVPFHTVVFPCSLIGAKDNYTLLNDISATEYLNYEDDKFSKSRGIGVFGDNAAETGIAADVYRFYLLSVRPESQDSVFNWNDFVTRNNSELLGNLGNFINRALTFVANNFNGIIPPMNLTEEDFEVVALVNREMAEYVDNLEKIRLREGLRNVLTISKLGNQYIQNNQPWVLAKGNKEDRARAGSVCALACNMCAVLSQLLSPYMPEISQEIHRQLQFPAEFDVIPDICVPFLPENHRIGKPKPLFQKIEASTGEELRARFSGGQVKTGGSKKSEAENKKDKNTHVVAVNDLEEAVAKQGDVVRKAKLDKADKAVIDAEVAKLLELKKQLALSKGEVPPVAKSKKKKSAK